MPFRGLRGGFDPILAKKKRQTVFTIYPLAEEEGFEPPVPHGTTVFKTAAIDHSATPLKFKLAWSHTFRSAKVRLFFFYANPFL